MPVMAYPVLAPPDEPTERYWTAINAPVLAGDGTITHIVSAVQDVTGEVYERRSEEARRLLMSEVDHRARNALAIVQSFVRFTRADTIEEFREKLSARVDALARIQTSLADRKWEGASLDQVVRSTLEPVAASSAYTISGPSIILRADQVQPLSLLLHELATNAGKYGSFSGKGGRLAVTWRLVDDGLHLLWSEAACRPIDQPQSKGFGSRLIEQVIIHLAGEIRYIWKPEGLDIELQFAPRDT
jgi:two-component sensor histidine kinase